MSRPSLFFELLASDAEPTRTAYENAIESVITYPSQVAGLVNDHDEDTFLFYLTTRSQRLATFYQRLQSSQHLDPKRPSTDAIAEGTVTLLLEILHPAHELLGDTVMLGLLAPALSICFTTRPHSLRKLAAMIAGCGKLLEHLASDPSGSRAICQWIEVPSAFVQETETLETWTARILHMARSCVLSHGVTNEIQRWKVLRDLKQALRNLDDRTSKNAEARPQDGVLRLANMTQLKKDDDKKAYLGKRQESHENQFPLLEDDLVRSLDVFELPAPRSSRMVQSLIEKLEGEITLGFLCGAAKTFPCKSCNAALQSTNQVWKDSDDETDEGILPLSDLPLDVFGKTIGIWKIVLSMPALRSIQNIRSSGQFYSLKNALKVYN
ncbi:hypothetical protein MMC28_009136 [Mycoblastus sanguinarius]|nr:hypothetical protein [Mycoblastus sanguinarius]